MNSQHLDTALHASAVQTQLGYFTGDFEKAVAGMDELTPVRMERVSLSMYHRDLDISSSAADGDSYNDQLMFNQFVEGAMRASADILLDLPVMDLVGFT